MSSSKRNIRISLKQQRFLKNDKIEKKFEEELYSHSKCLGDFFCQCFWLQQNVSQPKRFVYNWVYQANLQKLFAATAIKTLPQNQGTKKVEVETNEIEFKLTMYSNYIKK